MKVKRNIRLMYAMSLLQGMVFYGPVATLYRQAAGVGVFQIAVIESFFLAGCLLLELPWGIVADRIGYKRTLVFCCGLYALSKVVFWRADGFAAFLLERLMLSVVVAGLSGVDTSILYLSAGEEEAQRVFGVYSGLGTAGLLLASLVYILFVGANYRLAGLLTVLSYGLAAALSLGLTEVKAPDTGPRLGPKEFLALMKATLRRGRLLLFLAGVALLNGAHQMITVFLSQLQYVRCGLSPRAIGAIYIGVTVIGMAEVFSGRMTRRLGALPLTFLLYGAAVAACAVLAVTASAWLSVAAMAGLRVSFSLFQPLQADLQNRRVQTQNRATELSVNALLIDCVGMGTNLVYGRLAQVNLSAALLAGAALCLIGAGCVYAGRAET